jgi:two-component system response regulator PrrA
MSARVLVVDDDPAITTALARGLGLEGFDVVTAGGGHEALAAIALDPPDVVVLDVNMPDLDGVTVARRLREDGRDTPICILSARDEIADRVAGLEAGADDYLVKPFALAELVARLRALLRRHAPDPGRSPVRAGEVTVDPIRRRAARGDRALDLTRREFDLLEVFARHPGIVLTRAQLLELVWGYDFEVESNVLDVFIGYLRRKLEADGEPRLLETVRGVGFRLNPAA